MKAWKQRDPSAGRGPTYGQVRAAYISYKIGAHMAQSTHPPDPDVVAEWFAEFHRMSGRDRLDFFYKHCPIELQPTG